MKIETERLIIDDIRPEDREDYFTNISHDKEVLETFICTYQEDLDSFDFSRYLGRDDLFAIREKESGRLIGIFVECDVDNVKKSLEMGYGFGSRYWGKGYATEAVNAMLMQFLYKRACLSLHASNMGNRIRVGSDNQQIDMGPWDEGQENALFETTSSLIFIVGMTFYVLKIDDEDITKHLNELAMFYHNQIRERTNKLYGKSKTDEE